MAYTQAHDALSAVYASLKKAEKIVRVFESLEGKNEETIVDTLVSIVDDLDLVMNSGRISVRPYARGDIGADHAAAMFNTHSNNLASKKALIRTFIEKYKTQLQKATKKQKEEQLNQPGNN